ncbi:MAG TPA: hypothetical protein VER06_00065, partial [Candidatus Methanoperedens sp.]|nr:hypothetical protein [Candidatus Methanoperedens sp.]
MNARKSFAGVMILIVLGLAAGCSRPVLNSSGSPSGGKDQYIRIKRVAVFPFENYSDTKDVDKTIDALLIPVLRDAEIFDAVEDTRFTRDVMKKLKITSTDILDREAVKKIGDEMNVQGIIYGKILTYGKGKEKDAASQVTMDLALVEPSTGSVLWVGNVSSYGGLTAGKVFGVTEGKTDIEVARQAVRRLGRALAADVRDMRAKERKGLIGSIRREEDQEKARLEKLKGETGKIQGEIDKAKAEATGIRESASKDAEKVKTDLELQKAAFEAEKSKTQAAQQEIDQEKLKVEIERKKIAEDLKKIEDGKKALEEARKKAAEPPVVPSPAAPAPAPAAVPAPPAESPPAAPLAPVGAPPITEPAAPAAAPAAVPAPPAESPPAAPLAPVGAPPITEPAA